MNTMPPNEPLDHDERELARILRALPSAEPSAALDARILRAAAEPSARGSRRRRIGWLGAGGGMWGIGSAAAAVLALGIGWQALYGGGSHPAPMTRPVQVDDAAESEGMSVEFKDQTSLADKADAASAPPPPPVQAPRQAAPLAAPKVVAAERPAPASNAPAPFSDAGLDEHVAQRAEAEPMAAPGGGMAGSLERAGDMAAKADARLDAQRRQRDSASAETTAKQSSSNAVAAPAVAGAVAGAAPAASSDALGGAARDSDAGSTQLQPAAWLAQIRRLRNRGETGQARAALLEFHRVYPHWMIPTDLAPLLRE